MTSEASSAILPDDLTTDQIRTIATGLGLPIPNETLPEVTHRFNALMHEMNKLREFDLRSVDPTPH